MLKAVVQSKKLKGAAHAEQAFEMGGIHKQWQSLCREASADCAAGADPSGCCSVKRIRFLLDLFQTHFVAKHAEDGDDDEISAEASDVDFVELLNGYILDDAYSLIECMDDFHHVHAEHLEHVASKRPFCACPHATCHGNKRMDFHLLDTWAQREYFGYALKEDKHLVELFVKYHLLLQHEHAPETAKLPQHSKFVTQVLPEAESVADTDTANAFEFGERFYYGKHFAAQKGDHFIARPAHANLKDEMLNNEIHPIGVSDFLDFMVKAHSLSLTRVARGKQARDNLADNAFFELPPRSPFSVAHVLSVIIYTNDTDIQYNFKKKACRRLHRGDTVAAIARRNAQIGHWYTLFVQSVFFYGETMRKKDTLYTGMSCRLLFGRLTPRFGCPLSTTVAFDVAQRFAKEGIVLELKSSVALKNFFLDVEPFSCFPEERERLFAFAEDIYIDSIRFGDDFRTNAHKAHFEAFRLFDCVLMTKSVYHPALLRDECQQLLSLHIGCFVQMGAPRHTLMDSLQHAFLIDEEYDTDACFCDLEAVVACLDERGQRMFEALMPYLEIDAYLRDLFKAMASKLKGDGGVIHLIRSEFEGKLNQELRRQIMTLVGTCGAAARVRFIAEYSWTIRGAQFEALKELETGEALRSAEFRHPLASQAGDLVFTMLMLRSTPESVWLA